MAFAFGRVGKGFRVLRGDGHGLVQLLRTVGDACQISAFKLLDDRKGNAADEADLSGLAHRRRDVADHEGRFLGTEHDAGDVVRRIVKSIVDDGIIEFGVDGSGLRDRVDGIEADGPEEFRAVVCQDVQVRNEIGRLLRFDVVDFDAGIGMELFEAFPRRLVEGLVVHASGIGDHGNHVVILAACIRRCAGSEAKNHGCTDKKSSRSLPFHAASLP
jgi:hypothetical protein